MIIIMEVVNNGQEKFSGRAIQHVIHARAQFIVQSVPFLISEGEQKPTPFETLKD